MKKTKIDKKMKEKVYEPKVVEIGIFMDWYEKDGTIIEHCVFLI